MPFLLLTILDIPNDYKKSGALKTFFYFFATPHKKLDALTRSPHSNEFCLHIFLEINSNGREKKMPRRWIKRDQWNELVFALGGKTLLEYFVNRQKSTNRARAQSNRKCVAHASGYQLKYYLSFFYIYSNEKKRWWFGAAAWLQLRKQISMKQSEWNEQATTTTRWNN